MPHSVHTLSHPEPDEGVDTSEIRIQTAVREPARLTLRQRLRFWILLLLVILIEFSGLLVGYWWIGSEEIPPQPEDSLEVTLAPPPVPPPPPPPPEKQKPKPPAPPLDVPLQSMQPRFEPLPEPSPALKQKESESKLAVARNKKEDSKPVARVGVSAPGMGAGFFDKWFYDAAKAVEAAYSPPPSERALSSGTIVVLEFTYSNGARSQIEILQSSGDSAVDAACVAAVRNARLPPTPTSFINRPIPIRVTMPLPMQRA